MQRLALVLVLGTAWASSGCGKPQQKLKPAPPGHAAGLQEAGLPAIVLPAAIPADAAGVIVLRTEESLYATIVTLDLLGKANADDVLAMRKEIDELLQSRLGLTLTSANRATAFFTPKEGIAVVLEGVEGSLRGEAAGEVAGVALHQVDHIVLAMHDGQLVLGQRAAVALAITAATGGHASLRDSKRPLADALVRNSKGVTLAAAIDVAGLPDHIRKDVERLGVEQATLSYGDEGIRASVYGPPEALARLREEVARMLDQVSRETERGHQQALQGESVWLAMPAIITYYQWKHAHELLVPSLEGRRLDLHVPITIRDPMVLAGFAGFAAAIAVPALTKYTRRSKTSEARVGVAQIFDGAASFFNEEQLRAGRVQVGEPKLVHRCPSDGSPTGVAGPTPPLSVNCAAGPGGRCVPVEGKPSNPWEYSIDLWREDPVWRELGFEKEQAHAFHYGFRWANDTSAHKGFGTCMFTAQAFGDLDDDGLFSTFERAGAGDRHGINAAAGLYIDQEVE
jgi:hypothetical protein